MPYKLPSTTTTTTTTVLISDAKKEELTTKINNIIDATVDYEQVSENDLNSFPIIQGLRPFNSSNEIMWTFWKSFHSIFNELRKPSTRNNIPFYATLINQGKECMQIFSECDRENFY